MTQDIGELMNSNGDSGSRIEHILAVDVGTQSVRTCILNRNLDIIDTAKVSYFPIIKSKIIVEIEAETLWNAFVQACSRLKDLNKIEGISFSTLCPSLLPMDSNGKALSPIILHMDRRSFRQARWVIKQIGEQEFLNITGNLPFPGGISLTSLLWIRDHDRALYDRSDVVFGHSVSFFMKRLTGRFIMDPSNASFTGLYDTVGYGDWHEGLLDKMGISREKLPAVVLSETVVGEIDGPVSRLSGLPKGIPVVIGANDTTCATVGIGVTEPGMLMNTSGTTEILVLCLRKPIVSKDHLLRTHAYKNRWLAMRMVGAGGGSLEWFRRTFCRELSHKEFYEEYLSDILTSDKVPEAGFRPFLTGDRHRIRQKTAAFTKLTLNTTREDLLLAMAYGIVSFQAEILEDWKKQTSISEKIFHVGGGASQAYTAFKQRFLKGYELIPSGETAVKGSAILGFGAIDKA